MSTFSHNKKVKMLQKTVADNMDYIKQSRSYLSEEEMKNKKYGMSYKVYIPDPGRVYDGLVANQDGIVETEYEITLKNKGNSCSVDSWDEIVNLEDAPKFQKEIVKPRATKLAREIQKDVIDNTIYRSTQAVVTTGNADFETLSEGAAKLREVAVAGDAVSFLSPTTMGKIAAGGLAKFIPDDIQKKIYGKNYLGEYAGASQIELQGLPVITTPSTMAATISLTEEAGHKGLEAVTSVAITGGVANASIPFTADGLKLVDVNGVETDQDYVIMADANGKIPELRISYQGQGFNNPNAWVASGTTSLTLKPVLASGTKYEVGSVRIADALAFDTYKFNKLAGVEELGTESDGGVRMEVIKASNGITRESLIRMDCPYAAGIPEPRQNVTVFVAKK